MVLILKIFFSEMVLNLSLSELDEFIENVENLNEENSSVIADLRLLGRGFLVFFLYGT